MTTVDANHYDHWDDNDRRSPSFPKNLILHMLLLLGRRTDAVGYHKQGFFRAS